MRLSLIFALLVLSPFVFAAENSTSSQEATREKAVSSQETPKAASSPKIPKAVKKAVKRLKKLLQASSQTTPVNPSPVNGLYEVVIGSEIFYLSADGSYFVAGNIYKFRADKEGKPIYPLNVSDQKRASLRAGVLDELEESEMVVFAPASETKHTINVFTDVDCGYCAKLHQEVPKLNEAGIKVRYLAFPRAGSDSPTYKKMVSVWCADDRQQAMTDAKARREIEERECKNSINKQYELGQRVGVRGTPAIMLSDGELLPGYMPAAKLIARLEGKE